METIEALRREREQHLIYLQGLLLGRPIRELKDLRQLREASKGVRSALEAQRERLATQRQLLEEQQIEIEQQLVLVGRLA